MGLIKAPPESWPSSSVDWSIIPHTKRLQVQFLVRAHTYILGSIPSGGTYRRQPISLSPKSIKHILGTGFTKEAPSETWGAVTFQAALLLADGEPAMDTVVLSLSSAASCWGERDKCERIEGNEVFTLSWLRQASWRKCDKAHFLEPRVTTSLERHMF